MIDGWAWTTRPIAVTTKNENDGKFYIQKAKLSLGLPTVLPRSRLSNN